MQSRDVGSPRAQPIRAPLAEVWVQLHQLPTSDLWLANGRPRHRRPVVGRPLRALYERVGRPVLVQGDMPSNAQAAGQFQLVIFDGPLEVDWNVGPLSLAKRAPSHVLLFARVGRAIGCAATPVSRRAARAVPGTAVFVWAMAPIGIKYIARRQTHRAISQIGLVATISSPCGDWSRLPTGPRAGWNY